MRVKGEANILLEQHMRELGIKFEPEFRFHPERKWRFDYKLPRQQAVEIEGAVWTRGRHTRGSGYLGDMEKYREAAALGWAVYRFSTQEVLKGIAREFLKRRYSGELQ